ncbi:MAG: NADH-quinone oxidoreductase subunit A [Candidatus Micrarchaeia archaeon]
MLYNYIALLFFTVFSIAIPAVMIFGAKLIRHEEPENPVKNAPYESGEVSIGSAYDVYNEYLPYFMIFIPFEIVVVFLILWAYVSRSLSYSTGLYAIGAALLAMFFAIIGYVLAGAKHGEE